MKSGMIYGTHGINGSGKTILLRVISGLVKVTSGQVKVDNQLLGDEISFIPNLGLCFFRCQIKSRFKWI